MRKALLVITAAIGLALLALLVYSVERSAWLLSMYEAVAIEGKDTSGPAVAMAAALVAELGAVALIVGEAAIGLVANERAAKRLARWAGFGLLLVLSLQSVAGLVAGFTRGGDRMLATLGAGNESARFAVAAVALLLGNLVVPGLILALSKIAAILVGELVTLAPAESARSAPSLNYAWARPAEPAAVPIYVEPAAQTQGFTTQSAQTPAPERTEPAKDRTCKYCGAAGLSAIEVARHGRARARRGSCSA